MKLSQNGFTLIEVVVSLVLVGVIAVVIGMGLVKATQGFLFTRMNTATLQKGQMSMTRISQEMKNVVSISNLSTATVITFVSYKKLISDDTSGGNISKTRTIRLNGETVEIDDGDGNFHTLTDQVAHDGGLEFKYLNLDGSACAPGNARIIKVTLALVGADGVKQKLVERVVPRNL